jgi:hypothetical protein
MYSRLMTGLITATLWFPAAVSAGPWFTDLEETMAELPWVVAGDIVSVDSQGVTALVAESFIGGYSPGDTLHLEYWEMGSWMAENVVPGEGFLLIPDDGGSLQIIGTPGRGYWLLRGYFDFNAFWMNPGVLTRQELLALCMGDSLPDRLVEAEIRFAGRSEFIGLTLHEEEGYWLTDSPLACLRGIRLDPWKVDLGGQDSYPWEPEAEIILPTDGGGMLKLSGRISSFSDGAYNIGMYPTGPIILDRQALVEYLEYDSIPSPPVIDIEVQGAVPEELGLAENPRFTTGESGRLHLTGIEGVLYVTSLYFEDGSASWPLLGFDLPMTCSDPLYFDLGDMPQGPSGNPATDIIDALAKGYVTGTLCRVPGLPLARFTLFMMR